MAAQELAGRTTNKAPTAILTRMRLLLVAASEAPKEGDAFIGTPTYTTTVAGICMRVSDINAHRYPKRFYCEAIFEQPLLESELAAQI